MKPTIFSITLLTSLSWGHVIKERTAGPLPGSCRGIGIQDGAERSDIQKRSDLPPWVGNLLNDSTVICGYLLANNSHTDTFQLPGFYAISGGFNVPALYELNLYPDSEPGHGGKISVGAPSKYTFLT